MSKMIAPQVAWDQLVGEVKRIVPEAFAADGRVLNLVEGSWSLPGHAKPYISPVDGTVLGTLPMLDLKPANRAVTFAAKEFRAWSKTDLDERKLRVTNCLNELREHSELLSRLLMWEIGKPYRLARRRSA
jgi:acyl-CoA reductase-like NAD-dependent aldehyde dehydrogenase